MEESQGPPGRSQDLTLDERKVGVETVRIRASVAPIPTDQKEPKETVEHAAKALKEACEKIILSEWCINESRLRMSWGRYALKEEMTVGPEGQVMIPKAIRDALEIQPGSKVIFTLEQDKVIVRKVEFDAVAAFEKIARSGRSVSASPHEYQSELEERARGRRYTSSLASSP